MDKFIPESPDKFLKKGADMSLAKFGHINAIVDQVTINESAIAALEANSGYTYTEVSISSAEILGMGGSPVEILPPTGNLNKYYQYQMLVEFTYGTVGYDFALQSAEPCLSTLSGSLLTVLGSALFDAPGNTVGSASNNSVNGTTANISQELLATTEGVYLTTESEDDATVGDGTLLVKIWYKVRTFGSEL